jgi:hypothetical protein
MKIKKMLKLLLHIIMFAALLFFCGGAQAASVLDTGDQNERTCNPHSYASRGNWVINDNATGLMWQRATAPGKYTWLQAVGYCDNLTLGGYSDWRLPTIQELSSLVDSGIAYPGPTINTDFFPDAVASFYWSSTASAADSTLAWSVGFDYGDVVGSGKKTNKGYVRAVRGKLTNQSKLADNGDGTISDNSTGLMWQKTASPSKYTWDNAKIYCENLTLGRKSDWRMPTRNELQSIADYSMYNPAADIMFFSDMSASNYWSSTVYAGDTTDAWLMSFKNGAVGYYAKSGAGYVRAVRAGKCASSGSCPAQKVLGEANQDLENLRSFRDNTLAKNALGRKAIEVYYNNAESINQALDRSPALRAIAQRFFEAAASLVENKQ